MLSNSTNKVIDPDVKPPYFNEFVLGYATPLMKHWSLDVFFMFRDGGNFIEDAVHTLPASNFIYVNLPAAERRYRALTFELNRQLANKWSLNVSYALSRFYGNAELDGTGSNGIANDGTQYNTSSFLQDGPGIFVEDAFRWGPLNQDRPHVFKALGTYQPLERVTLGGSLRVQSGTPYAAMGQDWYGGYRRFLEPAGSRRNDTWTNVDLLAAYRLPLTRSRQRDVRRPRAQRLRRADGALPRHAPVSRRPHPLVHEPAAGRLLLVLHRPDGAGHDAAEPAVRPADGLRRSAAAAADRASRVL